jgi:hypothetical protein
MTIADLKYVLCMEFGIKADQVVVREPDQFGSNYRFDGTVYLVIDANILSQDVNEFLRRRAPIGVRFITVTAGWRR